MLPGIRQDTPSGIFQAIEGWATLDLPTDALIIFSTLYDAMQMFLKMQNITLAVDVSIVF